MVKLVVFMFIAKDLNQFKSLFVNQLKNMLSDDELGAFILVLANSHQDNFLNNELKADLTKNFIALKNSYSAGRLKATQDDIDVFTQSLDLELEDVPVWQSKEIGEWELVYNAMRKLRPARSSSQILHSIKQPYDKTRFHFNKPFLKPEILWEGMYEKFNTRVLFNKFPFSDYHMLIVVSSETNSPQVLTQEMHRYACSLMKKMSDVLPGFGLGFNSLAAGASVNHFHFQGFVRKQAFAIEKEQWLHHGGNKTYPLEVKCFSEESASWNYIATLIKNDDAFNCLYRNNICYVVPRKYQGTVELPEWLSGAGWIDVAGSITVSDESAFNTIGENIVTEALSRLSEK